MKLTVIGSSPAWPNPGSAHAGYLLEGSERLLLDCGPGVLSQLRAGRLLPVDAIAITHFHLDHWGDLVPWVWLSQHRLSPGARPRLLLPPGGAQTLAEFGSKLGYAEMFEQAFDVVEYQPRVRVRAAGLEIEAYPVEHYEMEAYGFRITDDGGRILAYSGDSAPCDGVRLLAEGADLFLCEATLAAGKDDAVPRGHMSAEEAATIARGSLLLTHRPAEITTPSGAALATDGMTIEV